MALAHKLCNTKESEEYWSPYYQTNSSTIKLLMSWWSTCQHPQSTITGTKPYKHIKPALRELHWLPVESQIIFKVLNILCPAYLSSLLQQYHPQQSLLLSSKLLFTVLTVNSMTHSKDAFSFSAPKLWNSLSDSVKNYVSFIF